MKYSIAAILAICCAMSAANADRVAENLERISDASRLMEFSEPGNRAYLLEKEETIPAVVAVIFGYADNRSACEQIERILSTSGEAGTFDCVPVY